MKIRVLYATEKAEKTLKLFFKEIPYHKLKMTTLNHFQIEIALML